MNLNHWLTSPTRSNRALVTFLAAVAIVVFAGVALFTIITDSDGAANGAGARNSGTALVFDTVPETTAAPATTTTAAPPPTTAPSDPTPAPSVVQTAPAVPPVRQATEALSPADALDELARTSGASDVTSIVERGSRKYAVMTVRGRAVLLEWHEDEWVERDRISTPARVRSVTAADVTGDGAEDFVIILGDAEHSGGVYTSAGGTTWRLATFATPTDSTEFVEALDEQRGRLRSELELPTGERDLVTWRWRTNRFTVA